MANDADVAVVVSGDTSQLRNDLKRGSRSLESFEDRAKKMQSQLAKVTVTVTAAGAALTSALYKQQAAIIDRLAKTADALGVTTENLQALRHMAGLAGVESEDLDKAIQRMSKGLGDAARKGGAAADALEDVGVNIDDILSMSADRQMEILARALGNVESHTKKASIASDLFGRNGLRMLKVLQQLESEGLKPTIDSIDAMGASLNRVDAAKVEDANDAVAKAMEAASGLAKELTVELAPIVEHVANAFTDWVKESGGLRAKLEELKPVFNALVIVGKSLVAIYGAQMVSAMSKYVISISSAIFSTSVFEKKLVVAQVAAKGMRKATLMLSRTMALLGGPVGLITLAASALFMFSSRAKETEIDTSTLSDGIENLSFNFEQMSQNAAKVALIDIEKPIRQSAKAVQQAQVEADAALRQYNAVNDSFQQEQDTFTLYMKQGFVDEAIVFGERAQEIKATIPEYEAALNRSNLVLEEAIAQEAKLMQDRESLRGVASGKTESDKESVDLQSRMENIKAANDAIIAEEIRLNEALILASDTEKLEMKYKGYFERRQEAQVIANEKLIEDHKLTVETQAEIDEMDAQRRRDFVSGTSKMFGDLSSLMGTENKRLFQIGKAAAIAQASIDGIAAAVSSYKFGASIGGPILGGAFAAASVVSTGVMLNQIKNQQFGGGAQTASVSSSAPAAVPQGANAGQTLTVQGLDSGAIFNRNTVIDLANTLLDFQRDGGQVVLGA